MDSTQLNGAFLANCRIFVLCGLWCIGQWISVLIYSRLQSTWLRGTLVKWFLSAADIIADYMDYRTLVNWITGIDFSNISPEP
jgi:hypothetical protein